MEAFNMSRGGLGYRRVVGSSSGRDAPLVVLIHGIPGSAASWSDVSSRLSDGGLDVVLPDLLGFGASDRPATLAQLHIEAQATAITELIDELGRPAAVIGHDFGGPVAIMVHALRPKLVSGIGLLATNLFTDTPIPIPLSLVNARGIGRIAGTLLFSRPSLAMMLRRGVGVPRVRLDPAAHIGDRRQHHAIKTIFYGSLRHLEALYRTVEDQLDRLDVPSFVAWGNRDPFFDVNQGRRTADALGVPLELYEGAGHFLPAERPAEVADGIEALVCSAARR